MSYLDPPRLHFAGTFAATISTVNNDPTHFDNATFRPAYQQPQDASGLNGWFNPRGDGDWRLMGCKVTSAVAQDGSPVTDDPVLGCLVADSDRLPPAKIVDLDPEQQLVSTIWGLELRICDANGKNLLRAPFAPAAFMDIWGRAIESPPGSDNSAAAMFQSILHDLEWGHVSGSPFLTALQTGADHHGRLSVKFNVDGINMSGRGAGLHARADRRHHRRGARTRAGALRPRPPADGDVIGHPGVPRPRRRHQQLRGLVRPARRRRSTSTSATRCRPSRRVGRSPT